MYWELFHLTSKDFFCFHVYLCRKKIKVVHVYSFLRNLWSNNPEMKIEIKSKYETESNCTPVNIIRIKNVFCGYSRYSYLATPIFLGDDYTDTKQTFHRKQIFHRTTILHAGPTKQADVDWCCRACSDPNPDTNASPWFVRRICKGYDKCAVFTFL